MNRTVPFDRCLFALYRRALRQRRLAVADHLLSAIEASAPDKDKLTRNVARAYRTIGTALAPAQRHRHGTTKGR